MLIVKTNNSSEASFNKALTTWRNKVKNTGLINELRERSFHLSPSEKRNRLNEKIKFRRRFKND